MLRCTAATWGQTSIRVIHLHAYLYNPYSSSAPAALPQDLAAFLAQPLRHAWALFPAGTGQFSSANTGPGSFLPSFPRHTAACRTRGTPSTVQPFASYRRLTQPWYKPSPLLLKVLCPTSGIPLGEGHSSGERCSVLLRARTGGRGWVGGTPQERWAHTLPVPPRVSGDAHSRVARWAAGRLLAVTLGRHLLPDVRQSDEQGLGTRPPPGLPVRRGSRQAQGAAARSLPQRYRPARDAAPAGRGALAGGRRGTAELGEEGAQVQGCYLHGGGPGAPSRPRKAWRGRPAALPAGAPAASCPAQRALLG